MLIFILTITYNNSWYYTTYKPFEICARHSFAFKCYQHCLSPIAYNAFGITIIAYKWKKKIARSLKEKNDLGIEMVKQMKINRLLIQWKNNTNKNDCGIYTM